MKLSIILLISLALFIKSSSSEQLNCDYVRHSDGYNCEMKNKFEVKKELTSVAGEHKFGKGDSDVEVFFLNDENESKYVPNKVCTVLKSLTKIDIYGNRLVEITKDVFDGCGNLQKLIIKYVKLTTINEDLLTNLPKLEHFALTSSSIETVPAKLFENIKNTMKFVDFSFNKLKVIKTEFPTTLTTLSLMNNECIDKHYDSRSARRTALSDFVKNVYEKCGNENVTLPEKSDDARNIGVLETQINTNAQSISKLESKVENSLMFINVKISLINSEFKALKSDMTETTNSLKKSIEDINRDLKDQEKKFHNITSKITDESNNIKTKLQENEELRKTNNQMKAAVNRNENLIIGIFTIQIIMIALVVCAVVYVKYFSNGRNIGGGLLQSDNF